jgi:Na+-translocating ferredoxin:NAD+ oxidoreductase subunit G
VGKPQPQMVDVKKGLDSAGNLVGWAFIAEGAGFADKIQLVVAVNGSFDKIAGYSVLSSSETPGFGDKIALPGGYFQKQFHDLPLAQLVLQKSGDPDVVDENIVGISGATVSSQAVVNILNNYADKVKQALAEKKLLQ